MTQRIQTKHYQNGIISICLTSRYKANQFYKYTLRDMFCNWIWSHVQRKES